MTWFKNVFLPCQQDFKKVTEVQVFLDNTPDLNKFLSHRTQFGNKEKIQVCKYESFKEEKIGTQFMKIDVIISSIFFFYY